MPRELVHWRVVQAVLEHPRLAENKVLFSSLHREKLSAYLGSLAHDVPYYYRAGHDPFEQVADYLHGKEGEDTFDPIRQLAAAILVRPPDEQISLWPFLFGMLTHMAADIVFHPMIFYFTGNYHAEDAEERHRAQARHRLFEVYLESWIRPRVQFSFGTTLQQLLTQNRDRNNRFAANVLDSILLPEIIWPEKFHGVEAERRWLSGFKQLAFYQRLFVSPAIGAGFRGFTKLSGKRFLGIDALFNFGRKEPSQALHGPLKFRNPVSGENCSASLDEMLQESIELSIEYILLFEPLVSGATREVDAVLGNILGSSLNYGAPRAKVEYGMFFSPDGFPLPGLTL